MLYPALATNFMSRKHLGWDGMGVLHNYI